MYSLFVDQGEHGTTTSTTAAPDSHTIRDETEKGNVKL
jgi:hypothetical protein